MDSSLSRRRMLMALSSLATLPLWKFEKVLAAEGTHFTAPEAFSFELLRQRAEALAKQPYRDTPSSNPKLLNQVDYDAYQKIQFSHQHAIWPDSQYPIEPFHLGRYAQQPVGIHLVSDGQARRMEFSTDLYNYQDAQMGAKIKAAGDLGYAGFRVMYPNVDQPRDWLAFQGASYFRSAGELDQYGLSARGIAVNTVVPGINEEFPRFTDFWIVQPQPGDTALVVYALLNGPSVTGAYRFDCRVDKKVIMDVQLELFQREGIQRLGIAALTSMYWYGETNARQAADWRPEIHDSDGLSLWTGAGERIWRPLNNPPSVQANSFFDNNPRGFGLLQRDRDFDHYHDDGVWYDKRPSVWIEPKGDWGQGSVMLVEIPTRGETDDNIVAFWVPQQKAAKGTQWHFEYRLHWCGQEPFLPEGVGRVVATRLGQPGIPGQHEGRDPKARKFVIDFEGGALQDLAQRFDLEVVVEPSRGKVSNAFALKVLSTPLWRAFFDLHLDDNDPVNIRCYLRLGKKTLTETWLYQYFPRDWQKEVE